MEDLARGARAEADAALPLDDRLAQAERDGGDAVRGGHRRRGIEVVRPRDAREIGIEALAVPRADDPLEDHGHLLLLEAVGRGPQVALGAPAERRGVDALDRVDEPLEPFRQRPLVRQHHRVVDAREGLVLRILEEARGADGDRVADAGQVRAEVVQGGRRERSRAETVEQLVVVRAVDREVAEHVLVEEGVEDGRAEDDGCRHRDLDVREAVVEPVLGEERAHEREAARLAAQRAAADAGEAPGGVERLPVEVDDERPVLVPPVSPDGRDEALPQVLVRREVGHPFRAQPPRERELRPRLQPLREMVALGVVGDRGGGHLGEPLRELLHVPRAPDLRPVGHAEDEVAEAEILDHEAPEVVEEDRRALQEERGAGGDREGLVLLPEGLEDDGHVAHLRPHRTGEVEARLAGLRAVARELDVRDDAEDHLPVLLEGLERLLVRPAEQDLRPRAHPHPLVREVHPLREEPVRVGEQLVVDDGEKRRRVADVVLDEEDDLDPEPDRVVLDVEAVLDGAHDRREQADVPLPEERGVDHVARLRARGEGAHLADVVGEKDDGKARLRLAHPAGEVDGRHVADVGRRQDEARARLAGRQRESLGAARHGRDVRHVVELREPPLVELLVLFEDEGVVGARDEQDLLDPVPHEVLEVVDARAAHAGNSTPKPRGEGLVARCRP